MRTVVLGALALTSGCNWVFGLDPVRLTDAQIIDQMPDARLPTVKLSAITPRLTTAGAPTMQAEYVPITPAPSVQYGAIGGALTDTTYTDGEVPVGYEFAEAAEPWRLVYTLAGGVPHELQWKPSEMMHPGHAVVMQLTPNDREPVPSGGMFRLAPTSPPATWGNTRVYTTNAWTVTKTPDKDASGVTVPFDTAATVPLAGLKRKPDPQKDFEVIADYKQSTVDARCEVVSGSAAFRIDLATGTGDGVTPMFKADTKPGTYTITSSNSFEVIVNLAGANALSPVQIKTLQFVTYGPGGAVPLYTHHDNPFNQTDLVPVPPGILLARCSDGPDTLPPFGYPSRVGLPTIATLMYATIPIEVTPGGPLVRNLVSISTVGDQGPFANLPVANLAFASEPTIDSVSVNIINTSPAIIPAGGTTASLDFMLAGSDPLVDLYEATLYRVDGTTLVPLREFTFTEKPLRFDRAQGQPPGTRYVFAIRAIRGASASVRDADFSVWGNTQWLGETHTQAFTLD